MATVAVLFWDQCIVNFRATDAPILDFRDKKLLAESNSQPFDQKSDTLLIELSHAAPTSTNLIYDHYFNLSYLNTAQYLK